MNLWILVIILLVIAVVLLIISFFAKEDDHALLTEIGTFTLQMTEDMHGLKNRIAAIEKSLSEEENNEPEELPVKKLNAITKQHAITLHQKGKTIDEIAEQLVLPETTVQLILDNHQESTN